YGFYRWEGEGSTLLRLVTAFDTRAEDVDALATAARRHAGAAAARQGT
ncbi:MAG: threonine aldolase, partial [Proteobacteria bacterium]|nr:threonine aldolase [Pseudomonadota bacterium]